jgi:wobble nucleotide-excising tRNase
VSRNVFETVSGSLENLPPVYVFGKESVDKQRQVDELKVQLPTLTDLASQANQQETAASSSLNDYAVSKAREIKNLLVAPGGPFNNYNVANFKADISAFERNPIPSLTEEERQTFLNLKDAKPLPTITLEPIRFPDLIQLHTDVHSALARTVVSNVISNLADNPPLASWIEAGLHLHTHDGDATTCKFCEQPLDPNRLRRLESHFNDEFRKFTDELFQLSRHIEGIRKQLESPVLPEAHTLYPELQAEYEKAKRELGLHLSNVRSGLSALASAVQKKQSRPFEPLALEGLIFGKDGSNDANSTFLTKLLQVIATGLPALSEYLGKSAWERLEKVVLRHNRKTNEFADEVKTARTQLHQHELAKALHGWKDRHHHLALATKSCIDAKEKKEKAENEIKRLEADLLEHRPSADELNRELISYLGHDEIQLEIEQTGYRLTRRGKVAGNLSEGEKTAIAFLYFLKSLSDRSFDLPNGVVVIDDPISSLDTNATYSAFGFMKRKLRDPGQLFVLTHNFTFFRQVRNWFDHMNRRKKKDSWPAHFYMLRASHVNGVRTSNLDELDPFLHNYESEYHYLYKRVLEAAQMPDGQPLQNYYDLPNLARRLLETFLAFKVPDESNLHARLEAVAFDDIKKTRIQRFVDTHSHAEQVGSGHDETSALAEAPDVLRNIIELIESCDEEHARRMRKAANL